jgi:YidC/Oxa1 family membrane protein insertase
MPAHQSLMEIFNTLVVYPLINVLIAIYHVLTYIHVPYALGFSIIGLTILIRVILYPLTNSQLRASKKMQALSPQISSIKNKYKGDNKKIQEETMKLYKDNGVNPAAGCLPTLVQLPILWGLYNVLNGVVHKTPQQAMDYVNSIVIEPLQLTHPWNPTFFGVPLGLSPHQLLHTLPIIAIAVPLITGIFQFLQSKMMFPTPPSVPSTGKDKKGSDDFATVFQKQSAYLFPIMIGFFSFNFPFGLSLYWNTFSIFGIIQQYKISGLGGLEDLWQKAKKLQKKK